jgi:hypothetical protein
MRATKAGVVHEITTRVNPATSVSQLSHQRVNVGWLHTSGGVDEEHVERSARSTLEKPPAKSRRLGIYLR